MIGYLLLILFIVVFVIVIIRRNRINKTSGYNDNNNIMTLDDKYNEAKVKKQQEIDRLLDKISDSGYDSLSKKEKKLLKDNSKKV